VVLLDAVMPEWVPQNTANLTRGMSLLLSMRTHLEVVNGRSEGSD